MARRLLASVVLAGALTCSASAATANPVAQAARSCSGLPRYTGGGYYTTLTVIHVGCATGKKLMVRYHSCRVRHGRKGRCTSRVLGYRCSEKRVSIATEFDARVTCRRGARRIVHTYQQDI